MDMQYILALVHYYAREGYFRHVQTVCNEVLKKRPGDPVLTFWKAYGLLMEGNTADAMRDLGSIAGNVDLDLAVCAAQLIGHEAARVPDHDAIIDLQAKLEVEERAASDTPCVHLASLYLYTKSKERARGLVERVLRNQPDHLQAQVLLGWIIVSQQQDDEYDMLFDESELDEAYTQFEQAVEQDHSDLQALLGKAKILELKKQMAQAVDVLAEINVRFAWFVPALVEKARLLMVLGDWEQVTETLQRVLSSDAQNIMAQAWACMISLTREGNNKQAAKQLQDLFTAMNRQEPKNAELFYKVARPFARLACSDSTLLGITFLMADRAVQLKPDHAPYVVEAAAQKLLMDEVTNATERFSQAMQLDELNLDANAGVLEAQILSGELEEAAGQVGAGSSDNPTITYLKGLLAWKQGSIADGLALLERAIAALFTAAAEYSGPSLEMYAVLNPARITTVVRLLLQGVGGEPRAPTEAPSPLISKVTRALDLLNKQAPALLESSLLHARALYLNGALDAALRKAGEILRMNPEESGAHLLICSVYVAQDKPDLALSALDQAVSSNFAVRETPLYHVVQSKVLIANGKLEDAKRVLESAMNLPGVRTPLSAQQRARMGRKVVEPTLHERATIYLLLADVLARISKIPDAPEAKKYIQDAIREFEGTSEEVRVTVADCELAIARGDVEGALKKLRRIPKDSPHYVKARMAMADIYLRHRKDKTAYIKCYMDLVDHTPDYDSYCMLGEAFMQIQEPEKAVRAFESALDFNPKDVDLITRCARALVTSHDYQRAIDYFTKAIANARGGVQHSLQLELGNLLVRLRQWQPATAAINKALERNREGLPATENLQLDVEGWSMLAKVHKGTGDMDGYVAAQTRALDLQKQLLLKLRGELPEAVALQRERTAAICFDLAEQHKRARKFDRAMELYMEALRHHETHVPSMLAVAKLHLANGDTDACQAQCVNLLKHDPDNEEASIMLAELMFHKEHYDTAIYHFQQLLERSPNHYGALAQLILLLRRAGRLEDVPRYFNLAETGSPKAIMDPGYHYCKGLYNRYTNNPREALKELNLARKDSRWGSSAILHMVEIYLNPDNDAVWEEKENADTPESREAVATARSLLRQVVRGADTTTQRYKVLECYAMMAGKDKNEIENALNALLDLANQDPNNVPVLLAMATGFMMLKQTPKARNQLKRVQKIQYKPDEAEEFERSWLLLADIHIQGGKYDLAQDLCQKCLKYNKSCAKAWEIMGQIMEKEQAYKDAADHYENAWKHENQASAQVGYKLAFNYLKAKRFVEAVDVCHKVIKTFPDYPKIRKDILEKARMGLKP
ncbi:hypothetical protein VOLCADRAFT_78980 [Volvox carteri f. nagariensis]|uniref:Tetratricopeptide repeat protein 21B n=1 Tax=Volvox carteri f. nagariensis TaxID=3068 RepID=D8TIT7_VOLCA|nr:uncharacterized protein VOLCADRAFT_78980 [Volvox carteri f. nagariensis]EFJ52945.1 hypothetical protein VOLCADRAFT_78980 [Volvox carteri f. nagariensis]|eukprot:XP_002945950.1 hypothetical protein VOLCADRAFT_78980 [Volvox carteri f. nagariensis]